MKYLILMFLCLAGCAQVHRGNCVPRAFFNAITRTIETHKPVEIVDMKGHWQSKETDGPYLGGAGWDTWDSRAEGTPYKVYNLREALEHFLIHNPWAIKE